MMQNNSTSTLPALVLALGIIASSVVISMTWRDVRSFDQTLSVTGSTKERVQSDTIKWIVEVSQVAMGRDDVDVRYKGVQSDAEAFKKVVLGVGISEDAVTSQPIFVNEIYNYEKGSSGAPKEFRISQTIVVQSADVDKVATLAKNLGPLLSQGIAINTMSLEYYYSKLPELRVRLLANAIKDAQARATEIATAAGKKVGGLTAASSGVVQVLAPNSVDVSDYGSYDTQSKEKEISVTVRASFTLK